MIASSLLVACGPRAPEDAGPDRPDAGPVMRCPPRLDPDEDTLSSDHEGMSDPDGDGLPNHQDDDSDGDGYPDALEAGDADCTTPPVDTDGDGVPDFLDLDANGDGVPDAEQPGDTDGDGVPDRLDLDVDGDGIANDVEWGDGERPVDTDGDGTPDVLDLDSDGDTILDEHEGEADVDLDGAPSYLDLDSDDDGVPDATEAGDADPATPPRVCDAEIDPITGDVEPDGRADYADPDSDNDGLADGEELALGTDPCAIDTDGDGVDDLGEAAYARYRCPDGATGADCGCATDAGCVIPPEHFYVVLPHGGPPVERDLAFATDVQAADVFFLTDTTGSMGTTLDRVQATVTTPGTGLIDRISAAIPDAWFGGGQHDDFPFGGYGSPSFMDAPFLLASRMTPPARSADVGGAFAAIQIHGGGDGPESQTEALYQLMTGEGGEWTHDGSTHVTRRYLGDCLGAGWGAACFRDAALPIVVLFTETCAHEGPPDESASCDPYTGIAPAPHTWAEATAAMSARGAKLVGINASSADCEAAIGPDGLAPCHYLRRTAEATGSVDLDGDPFVYDLPDGGASDAAFVDTVVGAIEAVVTRVRLDVDTGLRDEASDPEGVDATRFITDRRPACSASPPAEPCWEPPSGLAHERAVESVDATTFHGVVPGTEVVFRLTFQNDFVEAGPRAQVFLAFVDVRAGAAVLATRQVIVVIPARSRGPLE